MRGREAHHAMRGWPRKEKWAARLVLRTHERRTPGRGFYPVAKISLISSGSNKFCLVALARRAHENQHGWRSRGGETSKRGRNISMMQPCRKTSLNILEMGRAGYLRGFAVDFVTATKGQYHKTEFM